VRDAGGLAVKRDAVKALSPTSFDWVTQVDSQVHIDRPGQQSMQERLSDDPARQGAVGSSPRTGGMR
jgi:hypothetical protein